MAKKKSSSSRHPERSRGISGSRPLSFWQFIRKNFLIIAGLLLLPVTVGAVVSSYNYANLGSAAGRRNVFRTQTTGPLDCIGKCYIQDKSECLREGIHRTSDGACYNCSTVISMTADRQSFAANTNKYDQNEKWCNSPTPIPSATTVPDAPIISYIRYDCDQCLKRYNYPPYDQFDMSNSTYRDSQVLVNKSSDTACNQVIKTSDCTNMPAPTETYPTAVVPTSVPPQGDQQRTGWEYGNDCYKGGSCESRHNDACKDKGGWARDKDNDLPSDCSSRGGIPCPGGFCKGGVGVNSAFDVGKAIKNFFGIFGF